MGKSAKSVRLRMLSLAIIGIVCMAQQKNYAAPCPCDIYQTAGTPCVAAHSTVRALFQTYNGPLYQVRRTADNVLKDIGVLSPGGYVNMATQDSFLNNKPGTISKIYDQTSNHNDLVKSSVTLWIPNGGIESSTANGKHTVNGHNVNGIYCTAWSNVAYRINATTGVPKNNDAEAMYAVVDGKRYVDQCCFDYGNVGTTGKDEGNGTMEAIYWGSDVNWGGYGVGPGPWVCADLENGMFKGFAGGYNYGVTNKTPWPTALTVNALYATTMLKGPPTDTYCLKAGDAQSGKLTTMWNGKRPAGQGYSPKNLKGAIVLGSGGDGSNGGTGTFFEGAITKGNPPDSIDDKIQANIVAAGYGRTTTAVFDQAKASKAGSLLMINSYRANAVTVISYTLPNARRVTMTITDLMGKRIALIENGILAPGRHETSWNANRVPSGVYTACLLLDGRAEWSGKLVIEKL
jgi:hypothetical protein